MQHSLCIKDTEEKFAHKFLNLATIIFYDIGPLSQTRVATKTKNVYPEWSQLIEHKLNVEEQLKISLFSCHLHKTNKKNKIWGSDNFELMHSKIASSR